MVMTVFAQKVLYTIRFLTLKAMVNGNSLKEVLQRFFHFCIFQRLNLVTEQCFLHLDKSPVQKAKLAQDFYQNLTDKNHLEHSQALTLFQPAPTLFYNLKQPSQSFTLTARGPERLEWVVIGTLFPGPFSADLSQY